MTAVPQLRILGVSAEEERALGDLLEVRGLLQQADDYVVMINTSLVRKGEVLQMNLEQRAYRVEVQKINKMKVVLKAGPTRDKKSSRRKGAPEPASMK